MTVLTHITEIQVYLKNILEKHGWFLPDNEAVFACKYYETLLGINVANIYINNHSKNNFYLICEYCASKTKSILTPCMSISINNSATKELLHEFIARFDKTIYETRELRFLDKRKSGRLI